MQPELDLKAKSLSTESNDGQADADVHNQEGMNTRVSQLGLLSRQ
jgi:hypothetical protein